MDSSDEMLENIELQSTKELVKELAEVMNQIDQEFLGITQELKEREQLIQHICNARKRLEKVKRWREKLMTAKNVEKEELESMKKQSIEQERGNLEDFKRIYAMTKHMQHMNSKLSTFDMQTVEKYKFKSASSMQLHTENDNSCLLDDYNIISVATSDNDDSIYLPVITMNDNVKGTSTITLSNAAETTSLTGTENHIKQNNTVAKHEDQQFHDKTKLSSERIYTLREIQEDIERCMYIRPDLKKY